MFNRAWGPCELDFTLERFWLFGILKKKCKEVGVEDEYLLYEKRLRSNSLIVFLLMHSIMTLLRCILMVWHCVYIHIIYIDIVMYILACIMIFVVLSFNIMENADTNNPWVVYVTSTIAVLILVLVDMFLHFYHFSHNHWTLTAYDTYILYVIYLFLPLPGIKAPALLGVAISLIYSLFLFLDKTRESHFSFTTPVQLFNVLVELLDNICFNFLGTFFRIMNDITIRSSFLDRHQYVLEDIMLQDARKQEMLLLHSILPPQIAQPLKDDIRSRVTKSRKHHEFETFRVKDHIMAIQEHLEVTILYADVVNYTYLTTTLSVEELITLLHELYAAFDSAAALYGTQRIKFLGDCYYCVSGLLVSDPDHANCCVNLGHCMIAHIREVRQLHKLDIDMRIGIHSGSILAGVIGATKLQYDIWGDDVIIASKLEATGKPGHLHISERTLSMMVERPFEILPGTKEARDDPLLVKNNIKTYLIAAIDIDSIPDFKRPTYDTARSSINETEVKDNKDIKEVLRKEFEQMPTGAFANWEHCFRIGNRKHSKNAHNHPLMGFFFLDFINPALEYDYIHQKDKMFKYSILLAWVAFVSLIIVQTVDRRGVRHVNHFTQALCLTFQTLILCIVWYKTMCYWRYRKQRLQYSSFSCSVFYFDDYIQSTLTVRVFIYMVFIVMYFFIVGLILLDCNKAEYLMIHIESKLYNYEMDEDVCFRPWLFTKMICLILGVTLIFTGIPFFIKIVVSILETTSYFLVVFYQYEYMMHNSPTTNPFLPAEIAHVSLVIITWTVLYYMERHIQFNNKVNYSWKVELLKKQEDARITNQTIAILLRNILPNHVVNVYLTLKERHELYYESYEMVAIMFASIKNFQMDMSKLRFLNAIISEFDAVLSHYRHEYLVEKIKIVGCTYMAACGLDTCYSDLKSKNKTATPSLKKEVSRAQGFLAKNNDGTNIKNEEVVFILTSFALDLMRTLWLCKDVYKAIPQDRAMIFGDMSIGISSGEVMAGVVGASKVHYDIWGNAVNMASRMDSTGIAGHIHVTEESAMILERCEIECDYRGMTFVKGRGILPTYFVGIDENLEFKRYMDSEE